MIHTTVVGTKGEMDESVRRVKEVMGRWEERNIEDKEEMLEFGTEEGDEVRILGSWMGGGWRGWVKGSRLSKRWQGRIVQACVENSLFYDCQARVWYKRDVNKLQRWMDKCYRYVWSDRNGEPLRQMAERHVNMTDVRQRLGIKSVEWKIERRVLERIGHVVQMENDRLTKAVVLGWWEGLEGREKMAGRKRKTVLYWRRVLREAGIDWTEMELLTSDRKGWKEKAVERMEHLDRWERQKGHGYRWEQGEERLVRNVVRGEGELVCRYEGCGKVCRNKAGLVIHEKRIHRANEERGRLKCEIWEGFRCGGAEGKSH